MFTACLKMESYKCRNFDLGIEAKMKDDTSRDTPHTYSVGE